jgi:tetratricopeptide (TPR) repeat protein
MDEAVDLLNADLATQPVMERINNAIALGEIAEKAQRFDEAWLYYQQGLIWHESRPRKNLFSAAEKAQLLMHLGHAEVNLHRHPEAAETLQAALQSQNEILEVSPYHESMIEDLALILNWLADAELELDHWQQAADNLKKCRDTYEFLIQRNRLNVRFLANGFKVRLQQVRLQTQLGELESAHQNLATLCSDFELLNDDLSERDELGHRLAELLIDWLDANRKGADSSVIAEVHERVKRWFSVLQQTCGNQDSFRDLQSRLDQIDMDPRTPASGSE